MRTIAANIISALDNDRTFSANAIVRDTRLRFTYAERITNGTAFYNGNGKAYDSCVSGSGVVRVANISNTLYYTWLSSPGGTWGAWSSMSVSLYANSRPAIHSERLFYQKTDGKIYKRDFSGGSFGGESVYLNTVKAACGIAPVSTTDIFIMELVNANYAKLSFYNGTSETVWPGRIYAPDPTPKLFDAENKDSISYIFFADRNDLRPWYLTYRAGHWSNVMPVIPMDVVDNETGFRMTGVELINNEIVFTGVRTSGNADEWLFYSLGPPWTMGRDCYIGMEGAKVRVTGTDDVPIWGGKMHLIGDTVYIIGPGVLYTAPATYLLGYDNTSLKLDLSGDLTEISFSQALNEAGRLTFELPSTTSHAALRIGSDIDLTITMNGATSTMGRFNIDAIIQSREIEGNGMVVTAASKGTKNLAQWAPDLNYDYWGQARQASNPATLSDLVRVSGNWEATTYGGQSCLAIDSLNEEGVMYSTARPSRNVCVKGRFLFNQAATDHDVEFGLLINYYRETKEQAAARLQIPEDEVEFWDYGENALAVVYGTVAADGVPGFGIWRLYDGTWFRSTTNVWPVTLAENTWHWIQADFYEGNLRIMYKNSGDWVEVGSTYVFESSTEVPWSHLYTGRAGLYMKNITPFSSTPGFDSESMLLPVTSNANLPTFETYLVDMEQIDSQSATKSNNRGLSTATVREGYTLDGANHTNAYTGPFTGNEIYFEAITTETDHDYYDGLALVITAGQGRGHVFKVTDYDYVAPDQWVPNQSYTLPDTWMDHIGDLAHGSWVTDTTLRRIFVEEDVDGITGEDTVFTLKPNMTITERGANGTEIVAHGNVYVHKYEGHMIYCDNFQVFSGDIDYSLTDMALEMSRKAGNLENSLAMEIDGTVSRTGWDTGTIFASAIPVSSFVAKVRRTTGDPGKEVGIAFGLMETDLGLRGLAITITNTKVNFYEIGGSVDLIESMPLSTSPGANWLTVSADNKFYCAWLNNRLVFATYDDGGIDIHDLEGWESGLIRATYCAAESANMEVKWPVCSSRVDNFIFDAGKKGTMMLDRLIGDRHIWFCDDQYGKLRIFRDGDTIASTFDLALTAGLTTLEQDLVTRVRVEGMEAYEKANADAMKEHGNLYAIANNQDVEYSLEAAEEAEYIIELGGKQATKVHVSGGADPRVEPGDTITVALPDGNTDIFVDKVTFKITTDIDLAVFDMSIEGY